MVNAQRCCSGFAVLKQRPLAAGERPWVHKEPWGNVIFNLDLTYVTYRIEPTGAKSVSFTMDGKKFL